jgi:hypothetical protein
MARGDGATRTLRQKRKHDRMKRKSQEVQGMPRRGTALSQKQEQIPLLGIFKRAFATIG